MMRQDNEIIFLDLMPTQYTDRIKWLEKNINGNGSYIDSISLIL